MPWPRACRSLEKEGQWTKFADTPVIEKAGGAKRAAPEPVAKFEGDVRALKQWRGDLITKCDEAKAAYQKALGASTAHCDAQQTCGCLSAAHEQYIVVRQHSNATF